MTVFLWRTWLENHLKTLRIDSIYRPVVEFNLNVADNAFLEDKAILFVNHW